MKKPKIKILITKENSGYSAHCLVKNISINTEGDSFEVLKNNIIEAVNLAFEDHGIIFNMSDIDLTLDLRSFFAFYNVINAKALSKRIGMNQSLLAQYISGTKKPSIAQTQRILNGVQQIGKELSEIRFLL